MSPPEDLCSLSRASLIEMCLCISRKLKHCWRSFLWPCSAGCCLKGADGCRDGESHNLTWNCGEEGPSRKPSILRLRSRQMRNLAMALLMAQGIPMILMGDEYGHSKVRCHIGQTNFSISLLLRGAGSDQKCGCCFWSDPEICP